MFLAFTILAIIIGLIMYRFIVIEIDKIMENTDAYLDLAFHECHYKSTVISHAFWMTSNLVLLALGYKLKSIVSEKTEELLSEKGSFYSRSTIDRKETSKLIAVRVKQVSNMMCILYLMVFCSTFTFIHTIYKYFFYSEDCNPVYLPREVATAIDYSDLFVTRQLWIYVISQFFWPTKSHIKDDEAYDSEV